MDIAITKMSSKGQIVIPSEMRKDIKEGEKLVVLKSGDNLMLLKIGKLGKKLEEDLEFARRTEEAWQSYERGEFKEMDFDEFIKGLRNGKRHFR